MIDAAELSSLLELAHLLRSPANSQALFQSMKEIESGQGMTLKEFRARHAKV